MRLQMPPKSDWYVHEFRSKDTKLLHSVATIKEHMKRKPNQRALCGTPINREQAWRRPPGSPPVEQCGKCANGIAALDDLLPEQ